MRSELLVEGRARLTVGLTLAITMAALESVSVATAMPAVARDLDGLRLYGWAFSAFMLGNLVGIAASGEEADRRGPLPGFTAGLGLFAAGLVVAGSAQSMGMVVIGRALQGLGAGGVFSTVFVAVGLGYPPLARQRLMAVLSSAWVVPGLAGPALAGAVADVVGWRWVFLGLVWLPPLVGALAIGPLSKLEPETPPSAELARDLARVRDAVLLAAGTALVLAGLGSSDQPAVLVALVAAGALVGWPAVRRLLPPGTWTAHRGLPAAVATRGLLTAGFFGTEVFVPLVLTEVHDQRIAVAGLPLSISAVTWALGAFTFSRAHRSLAVLGMTGAAFIAAGVALVSALVLPGSSPVLAWVAWAFAGFGMGLAYNATTLTVFSTAPEGQLGRSSASVQLADALGFALGTGVAGAIVAGFDAAGRPPEDALTVAFPLMLGVVLLVAVTARRLPRHPPSGAPSP